MDRLVPKSSIFKMFACQATFYPSFMSLKSMQQIWNRGCGGFFNHPSYPYRKYFVKEYKNNFCLYCSFKVVKKTTAAFQTISVFSIKMSSSMDLLGPLTAMERFVFNFFEIIK